MMKLSRITSVFFLLLTFSKSFSQINDSTFNVLDKQKTPLLDPIYCSDVRSDGKIIIGGNFKSIFDVQANNIARLNANSYPDPTFNIGTGFDNDVRKIRLQSDEKIIVGGSFTRFNNKKVPQLVRLNQEGELDSIFKVSKEFVSMYDLQILPDDKIIIQGKFNLNSTVHGIFRLHPNGSLDTTFKTIIIDSLGSFGIQKNGMIVTGKIIKRLSPKNDTLEFHRYDKDGHLDPSFKFVRKEDVPQFDPFDFPIHQILPLPNGDIIVSVDGIAGGMLSMGGLLLDSTGKHIDFTGNGSSCTHKLLKDGTVIEMCDGITEDIGKPTTRISNSKGNSKELSPYSNHFEVHPDGKIIVFGGLFEFDRGINIKRLTSDLKMDYTFSPITGFDNTVSNTLIQPDGKIVSIGPFNSYNKSATNGIVRLLDDGSIDSTFNFIDASQDEIMAILLQKDGKIILGKRRYNTFSYINRIVRLNTNGTLDPTFNLDTTFKASKWVLAIQEDGKIIVVGNFSTFNGKSVGGIVRLNTDGSIDNMFNVGTGFKNPLQIEIFKAVVQSDGKILLAGVFSDFNGIAVKSMFRINSNGTFDTSFEFELKNNYAVHDIMLLSSEKLLLRNNSKIVRILSNGSVDTTFNNSTKGACSNMILQPDGKILCCVQTDEFGYQSKLNRLNPNGSIDSTFKNANTFFKGGTTTTITMLDKGKILVTGGFTTFNSIHRNRIARIIIPDMILGTESNKQENIDTYLKVFPNPSNGYYTIECEPSESKLYSITSLCGNTLETGSIKSSSFKLDISKYDQGFYILTVGSKSIRLLKQ